MQKYLIKISISFIVLQYQNVIQIYIYILVNGLISQ